MKETAVARRYAKAFAEQYGDQKSLDTLGQELKAFAGVFQRERRLRAVMLHPSVSLEDKGGVLAAILGAMNASEQAIEAIEYLLKKDRLPVVGQIATEFERIAFEILGKVRVEVTSATELTDKDVEELTEKLSAQSGKEAVVSLSVDPSLIGGAVARIGSVVYDGSVRNQLRALRVGLD